MKARIQSVNLVLKNAATLFALSCISISIHAMKNDNASEHIKHHLDLISFPNNYNDNALQQPANECIQNIDNHVTDYGSGYCLILNMYNCNLSAADASIISDYLIAHKDICVVTLSKNNIGDAGAISIASVPTILSLYVDNNKIGSSGAIALAKSENLVSLDIQNNKIGNEGVIALSANTKIQGLYLDSNDFGIKGLSALAENNTIRVISLSDNKITDAGAYVLASKSSFEHLYLHFNKIGDSGAIALSSNKSWEYLDLAYNQISDLGAAAFANNTVGNQLNLGYNKIADKGAIALAKNTRLVQLSIDHNQIGNAGIEALKNSKIDYINYSCNPGSHTDNQDCRRPHRRDYFLSQYRFKHQIDTYLKHYRNHADRSKR